MAERTDRRADRGGERGIDATGTGLPRFPVNITPPDLAPWRAEGSGVPGLVTREGPAPGPHVALLSLMHGNEFAGAIVLDRLLRSGFVPARGKLTCCFVNLAAFDRFDAADPTASRFVDEDLNRLWDRDLLDGPRRSLELDRARTLRPLIDDADVLVDLHSMLWPSEPLILSGLQTKGRGLAEAIGIPALVVADAGHAAGPRLIDFGRFADPADRAAAVLIEAGQHWEEETVTTSLAAVASLLRHLEMAGQARGLPPASRPSPPRYAEVTQAITAATGAFAFVQPWQGGQIVPRRNTLIALDGHAEIRTPYDDCLLVMPSLRPGRGHTAVRLARVHRR